MVSGISIKSICPAIVMGCLLSVVSGCGNNAAKTGEKKSAQLDTAFCNKKLAEYVEMFWGYQDRREFREMASLVHPEIVKSAGGIEVVAAKYDSIYSGTESSGRKVIGLKFGSPSPVLQHGNSIQARIPMDIEMRIRHGRVVEHSALIGFSFDAGNSWSFIDIAGLNDMNSKAKGLVDIDDRIDTRMSKPSDLYPDKGYIITREPNPATSP